MYTQPPLVFRFDLTKFRVSTCSTKDSKILKILLTIDIAALAAKTTCDDVAIKPEDSGLRENFEDTGDKVPLRLLLRNVSNQENSSEII